MDERDVLPRMGSNLDLCIITLIKQIEGTFAETVRVMGDVGRFVRLFTFLSHGNGGHPIILLSSEK